MMRLTLTHHFGPQKMNNWAKTEPELHTILFVFYSISWSDPKKNEDCSNGYGRLLKDPDFIQFRNCPKKAFVRTAYPH